MSPFVIGMVVFFLAAGACVALYLAITPPNRAVDERFADLAVKMRAAQGGFGDDTDQTVLNMLFRWASKRVPPPNLDTPTGEKLQQTLHQAGFLKSTAPQTYQVARFLMAIGGGILGLLFGALVYQNASQPLLFGGAGVAIGVFAPSYYLGRRARTRQNAISDSSRMCSICWWCASKQVWAVRGDSNRGHGMRTSRTGNRNRAKPGCDRHLGGRFAGPSVARAGRPHRGRRYQAAGGNLNSE